MDRLFRIVYNSHINDDILTMAANMALKSVTNKLKLSVGLFTLCYGIFEVFWFFSRVYMTYDINYVVKYATLVFNNIHTIVTITQLYLKHKSFQKLLKLKHDQFWPLNYACLEARQEIARDMKIQKFILVSLMTTVLVVTIMYFPLKGFYTFDTLFCVVDSVGRSNMSRWLKYIFEGLTVSRIVPQGYFLLSYLFTLCYFVNSYRYQVIMIQWKLRYCCEDLRITRMIIDDDECQHIIKLRLSACIRHHIILCSYAKEVVRYFYYTLMWQIFSGISLFTILVYIVLFHNASSQPLPVVLNLMGGYAAVFLYSVYGQLFQEQTNNIFDAAIETDWINFNGSNRKILLIFLLNLKRQYQLIGGSAFTLNLNLFIWFSNKIVGLLGVVGMMET